MHGLVPSRRRRPSGYVRWTPHAGGPPLLLVALVAVLVLAAVLSGPARGRVHEAADEADAGTARFGRIFLPATASFAGTGARSFLSALAGGTR